MPDDPIPMQIGRLEGRLGATESRLDRHETFVSDKFMSFESKLDHLIQVQTQGQTIMSLFRWALMIIAGASGWFAWIKGHGS